MSDPRRWLERATELTETERRALSAGREMQPSKAWEREVWAETRRTVRQSDGEIGRLGALGEAVRLGDRRLDPGGEERLRQFLLSRQEIVAGDRFVLAHLRGQARARQRFVLGFSLAGLGAGLAWWAWPRRGAGQPATGGRAA